MKLHVFRQVREHADAVGEIECVVRARGGRHVGNDEELRHADAVGLQPGDRPRIEQLLVAGLEVGQSCHGLLEFRGGGRSARGLLGNLARTTEEVSQLL